MSLLPMDIERPFLGPLFPRRTQREIEEEVRRMARGEIDLDEKRKPKDIQEDIRKP